MDKKLRVVSLFSGCGGLDLGFEKGLVNAFQSVVVARCSVNEKQRSER